MKDSEPESPTAPNLRTWFDAALQQPEPARLAWLASHCEDPAIRTAVAELLAAHARDDEPYSPIGEWFLAMDSDADDAPTDLVGRTIADYRLLRQLGSGGMATVFLAERSHADYDQRVAIKILRRGVLSPSELRMFRRERQMLAALDHPNIARLIDGGVTEQGLPYLVLEFVDGLPITDHCRHERTPLRERVELACAVCRAVEHAHRALIVHRDIKPANVLVNHDGVVKLLDFGVAKLLHADARSTQTVDAFMTPEYAAPEQALKRGDSPALDVYALGVLLHELLLGVRPPRDAPVRPSRMVTREEQTGADPSTLRRFLSGDLDNIIERALQPEPLLRYRNAGELADDLQRFLDGQPVLAHPPSAWYRTRKFVARHRGAVGVTAALVLAVLSSLAIAAYNGIEAQRQANRAELARQQAEAEAARANAVVDYVLGVFGAAQEVAPERDRLSPAQMLDIAQQRLEKDTTLPPLTQARLWDALARISDSLSSFDRARKQFDQALAVLAPLTGDDAEQARAEVATAYALTLLHAGAAKNAYTLMQEQVPIERLTEPKARLEAWRTLAEIEYELGKADDAIKHAQAAADEGAKAFAAGTAERENAAQLPDRMLSLLGRHGEALPGLEKHLSRYEQLNLPRDIDFATLETAVAIARYQAGKPDEGLALIDIAIADVRAIHGGPSVTEVSLLESAAGMRFSRGMAAPAAEQLERALAAGRAIYPERSAALISLELTGATFAAKADPASAIPRYEQVAALCAAHENGAQLGDCGRVHLNLASVLTRVGRLDDAARELALADAHQRRLYGDESAEAGSVALARGNLDAKRGRFTDALAAYDVALHDYEAAHLEDQRKGRLLLARAQAQHAIGQVAAARASVDAAVANFDRYLVQDTHARADARAWLAVIAAASGASSDARQAAKDAMALDAEVAGRLPENVQTAFEAASR